MESKDIPQEGDFKMKKKPKMKKLVETKQVNKVDLTKKEEPKKEVINKVKDAVQEKQNKSEQNVQAEKPTAQLEEVTPQASEQQAEVTEKEVVVLNEKKYDNVENKKQTFEKPVSKPEITLPENVEKLVKFMKDTGGTVEDYVTLNKDYDKYDDTLLVREYYKKTRPHLSDDEVSFIMEDNFKYDEEVDEERFVKKQKLKYKEEVAKARTFLDTLKSKYYDEIKLRPSSTKEQQKAMDFFNRYNEIESARAEQRNAFVNNTKDYFQENFEGFNFEVGDKRFRYKVNNAFEIADNQSDVSKFMGKFADDKGQITDLEGYHKALFVASNADKLMQHFYEQGKADATRDIVQSSKNINQAPRSGEQGEVMPNGWRVKAITGVDSTKLKIKKRT